MEEIDKSMGGLQRHLIAKWRIYCGEYILEIVQEKSSSQIHIRTGFFVGDSADMYYAFPVEATYGSRYFH